MSKTKKARVRYVVLGVVLAALLGGLGLGFGLGSGGRDGSAPTVSSPPQITQSEEATPEVSENLKYVITVSESAIEYKGQSVTPEQLRELLLKDYSGTEVFELRDERAIKSVYDSVKGLLDELDMPYMEK